jgi:RNA polymerase sigma-70 factor (ECF subfamily)
MPVDNGPSTRPHLLRRLRDLDDDAAWAEFVALYRPKFDGWCRRWGLRHHDAEEVSAAVLGTLVKAMPTFVYDPSRSFRGWLKAVVDNEVKGLGRRRKRHPEAQGSGDSGVRRLLEEVPAPPTEELVDELSETLAFPARQLQKAVAAVQRRLKKSQSWQAFYRQVVLGEPAATVAAALGMKVGAVYQARKRVGDRIRDEINRVWDPEVTPAGGVS